MNFIEFYEIHDHTLVSDVVDTLLTATGTLLR